MAERPGRRVSFLSPAKARCPKMSHGRSSLSVASLLPAPFTTADGAIYGRYAVTEQNHPNYRGTFTFTGGTYYIKNGDQEPFDDSKFKAGDEVASYLVYPLLGDRGALFTQPGDDALIVKVGIERIIKAIGIVISKTGIRSIIPVRNTVAVGIL